MFIISIMFLPFFSVIASSQDEIDWGVLEIEAEKVWSHPPDYLADVERDHLAGNGINIAILDSGVYQHWELVDRFDDPRGVKGWNGEENGPSITPIGDHGTRVAGIVASSDNDEGIIGVAPLVRLYSLVNAYKIGEETAVRTLQGTLNCLQWAIDTHNDDIDYNDIDIINMSFGWSEDQSGLASKLNQAKLKGIILVAASGNSGELGISYPAWYDSTIAVGAINPDRSRRFDSNYGPKLDFVAPGVDIKTTNDNPGFTVIHQTSAATPFVTGVCALILSAQAFILPNSKLSPDEVKYILQKSAIHLGDGEPGTKNDEFGYGLVNAKAAVDLVLADSDTDGICDELEDYYGYYLNDPDMDGDTFTDGYEHYILGTDPEWFNTPETAPWYTNIQSRQVTVNWDSVPGADNYDLYKGNGQLVQSSIYDTHYTVTNLQPETTYSYKFRADNNKGPASGFSPISEVTTVNDPPPPPGPPTQLSGIGDGISKISLFWKKPSDVTDTYQLQYKIYMKVGSTYQYQATVNHQGGLTTTQLYTKSGLSTGVTYYFRVRAVKEGVAGSYAYWSGVVGFGWPFNKQPLQLITKLTLDNNFRNSQIATILQMVLLVMIPIIAIRKRQKKA